MHSSSLVEQHYTQGNIYETIILQLQQAGIDTANITRKDIAAVDEFHIRGQEMTRELANQAALKKGMRILDVGCGLGGPCRLFAEEYGCMATGIDITAEYIDTANKLSKLTGLDQGTHFVHGSATDLPFPNNSFDIAWTQHVQMNIADKKKFYAEINRVLVPGGRFVYYDVFGTGDQSIYFPVPWADGPSISHLITTHELKEILAGIALSQIDTTDQTAKSIAFFEKMLQHINREGLPTLGTHLMMGDSALEKLKNVLRNLSEKKIVVESGIAKKQ
jgi:ubiquinone/menaquinone biosynthesis C-methylase UbiE